MIRSPSALIVCVLIGQGAAGAAAFQPTSRPSQPFSIIKVDQSIVELGACWCGSRAMVVFTVQNIGSLPLDIVGLRKKPGFVLDPSTPRQIGPSRQAEITVHTLVPSKVGPFEKQVTLETNDPITPGTMLTIRGIARPAIEVNPPMAGFGKIAEGQPKELVITLTNHLDEPVKIELEKIEETTFSFALTETKHGEEYQLKVNLKPPFEAGLRQSTVNLTTDVALQPNIPIRAVAYLSPRIEIVPNTIRLGPPNTQSETAKILMLSTNGEAPLRLIEAQSDDPAITLSVADINPGRAYRIVATFPKGYDPGPRPKIITLHTDDPRQPKVQVAIIGPAVPTSPMADGGVPVPIEKLLGKPAPKFELTTTDGKAVNNATAVANVLALNFFTSHNFDNTQIVQKAEQLRTMYEPRGVRFLNVAEQASGAGFSQEEMVGSLKKIGVTAELAMDLGNIVAENFHLTLYPTFVVVGKTGNIEIVQSGNPPDFTPSVKARMEALLGPTQILTPTATSGPTLEQIRSRPALGMIGLSVPSFSINTLDGKPVGDAEIQNAPATVLNFVATNCGFCRRQLPMVESIRGEYEKKGVRFVNISQTMKKKFTSDEVVKTIKSIGNNSELAYDPGNKIGALFKVTSFPTMAVIRRDGRIENVTVGAKKNIDAVLRDQLDAILKGDAGLKGRP